MQNAFFDFEKIKNEHSPSIMPLLLVIGFIVSTLKVRKCVRINYLFCMIRLFKVPLLKTVGFRSLFAEIRCGRISFRKGYYPGIRPHGTEYQHGVCKPKECADIGFLLA